MELIPTAIKTETYKAIDGFLIDIEDDGECYNAYIWHEKIGVKDLMFGMLKTDISKESFIDLVKANFEDYRAFFEEDYMD